MGDPFKHIFNKTKYFKEKPVLITTTIINEKEFKQFEYHTMCVYGYRLKDGIDELLVHTGWDTYSFRTGKDNEYFQTEVWINAKYASFTYYFSFINPLVSFTDVPKYHYTVNDAFDSNKVIEKQEWSYPGILYVAKEGLMTGTSDTKFSPASNMTRAMLVTVLYRMAGKPSVNFTNTFCDVSAGDWYANAVIWASNNKIVTGVGTKKVNGTIKKVFDPNGNITREQLAVILYRYAQYRGHEIKNSKDTAGFADNGSISVFAQPAMRWAYGNGIITGEGNYLKPKGYATRAQIATIIMRYVQKFGK